MESEEPPLHRGHRHAAQAAAAESSRSWTTAMYQHQEAANCFVECLGLTQHPQANRAILLLILNHTKRFYDIREKLAFNKTMKNILRQSGYHHHRGGGDALNADIYSDLRVQMQSIVSIAHKNIIIPRREGTAPRDDASDRQRVSRNLAECDVRKSVDIEADDDRSTNIAQKTVVLNDNFFNPDHSAHSKTSLIANHQKLTQRVQELEAQLRAQTDAVREYQSGIQSKVQALRQSLDHLFNVSHPDHSANDGQRATDLDCKEVQDAMEERLRAERARWQSERERFRNVHAKQLQELKRKIRKWMDYAQTQEKHAKIYKERAKMQHAAKHGKGAHSKLATAPTAIPGQSGQIYHRGTLSRAKKNAIPESEEIDRGGKQ